MCVNSLGETTTGVDGVPVIFGETAPDAVWLADGEGVGNALRHIGQDAQIALAADSAPRGQVHLSFWVEENAGILSPAGPFELPIPNVSVGSRKP